MKVRLVPILFSAVFSAYGQTSGSIKANAIVLGPKTVGSGAGQLPAAAAGNSGWITIVTDGANGSDCTVGGGSSVLLCRSTGSAWVALGNAAPQKIYSTQSSATNDNISAVTMVSSTSAMHAYMLAWTISLTTAGANCTGNTTVTINAIFTDPNASGSVTLALGTVTLATAGNGTVGFIASGIDHLLAKTTTAVQYSTSSYTAGTGCTTNPTYQVSPTLVQLW